MKTIVITGAAGGMGAAAAARFLAGGWQVWALDRRAPAPAPGLRYLETDLTDPAAVRRAAEALRAAEVGIDALLHMAGIYDLNSLVEMEEEAFVRLFEINLFAAFRVNRALLPLLRPGARVLHVTSELAPLSPLPFTGVYAVSKAALEKYALSLRMELQLLGHPVIVLRPGAVETPLLDVSTRRLEAFCRSTALYPVNAARFRSIVERVEARSVPPRRVADLAWRAATAPHPRAVYNLNRNPLLRLLNALPLSWQNLAIREVLKP